MKSCEIVRTDEEIEEPGPKSDRRPLFIQDELEPDPRYFEIMKKIGLLGKPSVVIIGGTTATDTEDQS